MFTLSDFGIIPNNIKVDLSKYIIHAEEFLSKRSKINILKDFKCIEDYIYILYWLRFEDKFSYSQIGKLLYPESKLPKSIPYTKYSKFGWNYSSNFHESEENFFNELDKLKKIKEQSYIIKYDELELTEYQINEYNELLEKCKKLYDESKRRHSKIKDFNYENLEHYFKSFYYMYKLQNLSTYQIAIIYNTYVRSIQYRLEELGFLNDLRTSQENTSKFNRRNYKNIMSAGRKTLNNSLIINGEFGSNVENVIRNDFSLYLVDYLNIDRYELIVGINNRSIIQPKEIDIPIVIVDSLKGTIYKFAIEINGDYFHEDNAKEIEKSKILLNKNWNYYSIWLFSSTKTQKDYGKIDDQIRDICNSIKAVIST
jgi:hypothetical protein